MPGGLLLVIWVAAITVLVSGRVGGDGDDALLVWWWKMR
jgi:hypothetical protein